MYKDYVFFILSKLSTQRTYGLLLAVIISAAMINRFGIKCTSIDYCYWHLYKLKEEKSERHYLYGKIFHSIVGCFAMHLYWYLIWKFDSIGKHHWIYILRNRSRVFLVGFFISNVQSKAIFYSAVISQLTFFIIYYYAIYIFPSGRKKLGYLWLNFIGPCSPY
jgi:hypothetical protein